MKLAVSVATVALLAYLSVVDGQKPPIPCANAFSKCTFKLPGVPKGCFDKGGAPIQMGQCWASQRIKNQKAAYFIPLKPGQPHYDSEAGPYGLCVACDWLPNPATDLLPTNNYADQCFFWDRGTPVKAPGEPVISMPAICPSNLKDCKSANWFEPNGPLAALADLKPNYKGIWFPPQDPITKKPLFCKGLNLGCETPTMHDLQLAHLAGKCNIANCKEPPVVG